MKESNFQRVELGERDFEILSALEKWGVLGLGQTDGLVFRKQAAEEERERLFFNEVDRRAYTRACYKRLRDLESAGYVRGHSFLNHPKVYGLTDRGHSALMERGRARILGHRREIPEALLRHEMAVNAVGLIIDQFLGLRVRTEIERRTRSALPRPNKPVRSTVPDLWVVDKVRPLAIEVELTQKSEARYKELWAAFDAILPYGCRVLYIAGWPNGVKCILGLTDRLRGWRVYVCGLEEFRASRGRCRFLNHEQHDPRALRLVVPAPPPIDLRASISRAQERAGP